jgi:hypothetical protein
LRLFLFVAALRGSAAWAGGALALDAPAARVAHLDERFGVPTFLWAERPLAGTATPRAPGFGGGQAPALRECGAGACLPPSHGDFSTQLEQAARAALARNARFYEVSPEEFGRASVSGVHDTGWGAVIVTFQARVGGLPVFREALHVVMDRELRAVALSGYLSPVALRARVSPPFQLEAERALAIGLAAVGGPPDSRWVDRGAAPGGYRRYALDGAPGTAARLRPLLFSLPGQLEPAYYLELDGARAFSVVVSARDGRVLFVNGLTKDAAFGYRVWADPVSLTPYDGPQGDAFSPHPTGVPDGTQAPFIAPQWVSAPSSAGDPWLPSGATVTTGNNVDAYADLSSPDGFSAGDLRASTTGPGAFDRVFDVMLQPGANAAQTQSVVTQVFYTVNFLHDWYYAAGFDEAAGNAQDSNLGRGGIEGDRLLAEAQDYNGRNNANMTTFADGNAPRLQLFTFDANVRHRVTVTAPAALAGDYVGGLADFGPNVFVTSGALMKVNDGVAPEGDGCETPFVNAAALAGKVALLDRGTCTFFAKVANAQAAGAIAAVVGNNTAGAAPPMPGSDPAITIPSLSLSQADAAKASAQLAAGVSVTLEREAAPDRDPGLDNAVVAHEWGHYLGDRLIGDANGLNNKVGHALAEGWSDFQALLLELRAGDAAVPSNVNFGGTYTIASYVHSGAGNDGYYYGLRRVPYSTDFAKNALTFKHLADGEPLPLGVATAFGKDGANNSEVHNSGEVWATMLWECQAALLRDTSRRSFAQAHERMRRYLVASMKATPVSPTLLEARDALLAVAYASDPADHALFAQAFARRGAGLRALAPPRDSLNNLPLKEDFTFGSDLSIAGAELTDALSSCDADGFLDNGEAGQLTVTVKNTGAGALQATTGTVTSATPGVRFPNGGALAFGPSPPFGLATATAEVDLDGATDVAHLDFSFTVTDPGLTIPGDVTGAAAFRGNLDEVFSSSATDDVEAPTTAWTVGRDESLPGLASWVRKEKTPFDHVWFAEGSGKLADFTLVSPPLQVSATGTFGFTFRHRYEFEARASPLVLLDSGVLELSDDGGATWVDLGGFVTPGYDGVVLATGHSALKGRSAFGGRSPAYPVMTTATVELGTAYQGKTVQVRFRVATDEAVGLAGWEVDDLVFTGLDNAPFGVVIAEHDVCTKPRPGGPSDAARQVTGGCGCRQTGAGELALWGAVLLVSLRRRVRGRSNVR